MLDVTTPFAIVALPGADPVDDAAIMEAHTALCALYPDGTIATRIANALPLVLERHTWTVTASSVQIGDYRVHLSKDGHDQICSCPDWKWKRKDHNGLCKHVCACECLRLAQDQQACSRALPPIDIDVSRPLLWHTLQACLVMNDPTVALRFDAAQRQLTIHTASVTCTITTTGVGNLDQTFDRPCIGALCADLQNLPTDEHDLLIHRSAGGQLVVLSEMAELPL